MVNVDFSALQDAIVDDLTIEVGGDAGFNEDLLEVKVKNAIKDVMMRRNYEATSYNEAKILADLNNFYSTISALAIYDYNQVGMNGQSSHNENSINRSWVDRDDLLKGVHAFVKCI